MNPKSRYKMFTFKEILAVKAAIRKCEREKPGATGADIAAYLNQNGIAHPNKPEWIKSAVHNFRFVHMRRKTAGKGRRKVTGRSTRSVVAEQRRPSKSNDKMELAELIMCAKLDPTRKERLLSNLFAQA